MLEPMAGMQNKPTFECDTEILSFPLQEKMDIPINGYCTSTEKCESYFRVSVPFGCFKFVLCLRVVDIDGSCLITVVIDSLAVNCKKRGMIYW